MQVGNGQDKGNVTGKDGSISGLGSSLFLTCKVNKLVTQWLQFASPLATLGNKNPPQAAGRFQQLLLNSPPMTVVFKHSYLHSF